MYKAAPTDIPDSKQVCLCRQVALAVNELAEFARSVHHTSQIICGDFNSPPDSVGYSLLSGGQLVDTPPKSSSNLDQVHLSYNLGSCQVDILMQSLSVSMDIYIMSMDNR